MSGRIRSIKPEVLEDEIACALSDTAWRLWVSLWVLADDHGNVRLGDRFLAANVWQDTRRDPSAPRGELVAKNFLTPYAVRSQRYGHINGWKRHQRVDHPGKERVPLPAEDDGTWGRDVAPCFSDESTVSRVNLGESLESATILAPDLRSPITITDHEQTGPAELVFEHPIAPDEKPQATPLLLLQPGPPTALVPERDVFEYWLAGWRRATKGTRAPKFDDTRRGKIRARLNDGYSVDDLKRAIDGMWNNPFNVDNKHYDIELVCRNGVHVDRYMALAPPKPPPSLPAEPEGDYAPPDPVEAAKLEQALRDLVAPSAAAPTPRDVGGDLPPEKLRRLEVERKAQMAALLGGKP